eukprot:5375437-Pyramimonas_sp.AAC.1
MDYASWCEMLKKRPRSMPGPDGLPYAVWKCHGASRLLYSCDLALFPDDIYTLPDSMRTSLLVFSAEGDRMRQISLASFAREPPRARGLSV